MRGSKPKAHGKGHATGVRYEAAKGGVISHVSHPYTGNPMPDEKPGIHPTLAHAVKHLKATMGPHFAAAGTPQPMEGEEPDADDMPAQA